MARRRGRTGSVVLRLVASLTVVALAVLIAVGAVYAAPAGNPAAVFSGGCLRQANSRNGAAIVTGKRLAPGDVRRGLVVIANESNRPAQLTLSQTVVVDTLGQGGVSLGSVLRLTVAQVTSAAQGASATGATGRRRAAERIVYDGVLAGLTSVSLGRFAAGESRTYLFTVMFPNDLPLSDSPASAAVAGVQGARLSITYQWTAAQ